MQPIFPSAGVVGTGAMGRGIAQMAAQAGSQVWLFDVQPGAAQAARDALETTWKTLVGKNRMDAATMQACLERIQLAQALTDLAPCHLVIEAVVERLDPSEVRSTLLPFNLSKAVRDRDPASNMELRPGDVVTHVADKPVSNVAQLLSAVAALQPGAAATLDVVRKDGKQRVQITPGKRNLPRPQSSGR